MFQNDMKGYPQHEKADGSADETCATESIASAGIDFSRYHFEIVLDIIQVHTERTIF